MPRLTLVWSAAIVGVSLALAAIPMLMLDARANDGAASMTALFGTPMVAVAALLELHRPARGERPFVVGMLPWVGGLVFGMLFLGIPATLLEPDYYDAYTVGGMLAVLGMFAFVMAFGVACGPLLWALVVWPAASVVRWVGRRWRGEVREPDPIALPAGLLAVEAVVLVILLAVHGEPQELVVVESGALLLGLHGLVGWYDPPPETGLWIVRALAVLILAAATALTVLGRGRDARRGAAAQSQTR